MGTARKRLSVADAVNNLSSHYITRGSLAGILARLASLIMGSVASPSHKVQAGYIRVALKPRWEALPLVDGDDPECSKSHLRIHNKMLAGGFCSPSRDLQVAK